MRPFLLLSLLLLSCAKVAPPSGGEVDRTPPRVESHQPAADATAVPLEAAVEILFSEEMDRQRVEEALFVSPEIQLRPRWRGRRLRLEMALQPGRTYVITVGTDARDLRNNRLEQSFTFAFATGQRLNRGQIAGRVFADQEPAAGAYIWAYDLEISGERPGIDDPQYRTQSGRNGGYAFSRLAAGRYLLLAFEDEDRDGRPDREERLALPSGELAVSEEDTARAGDLALVERGRPRVQLQRVQAVDDRRLLLQFAQAVDPEEVELEVKGLEVEEVYGSPLEGNKVYARTGVQEPGREYVLSRLRVGEQSLEWEEKVRGSSRPDRTPPELVARFPEKGMIGAADSLELVFGEGMEQVAPGDFWMASDSTQALVGRWYWATPTRLIFRPEAALAPGEYRLKGRGFLLRDRAGQALGDSLIHCEFSVPGPEELAGLRGRVEGPEGSARVRIQREGRMYSTETDSAGEYAFADLLPGRYAVWAFADLDGDGAFGAGALEPFAFAEPYGQAAEVVELTEGETVEGIDLRCR